MKRSAHKTKAVLLTLLVSAFLSWTAVSVAAPVLRRAVELTAGQADTIDLGTPVADILVANPSVVDVGTMRANRLYIVGKSVGDTNVLAFDAAGNQMADIGVHVSVDGSNLRSTLKRFFPDEEISARTVKNDIVLTGAVSTPIVANQVRDLAARFLSAQGQTVVDLMEVKGEQQVMLKVRVIEAKRDALREFGFDANFGALNDPQLREGAYFSATGGQTGMTALAPFGQGGLFINNALNGDSLTLGLNAMEQDGLANTLAEPTLTAISGETASFLAGGEFPVPTSKDSEGNIVLTFKKFGVSLNFVPTVMSEDRIALQLSTEVSEKSQSANDSVQLVGTTIPGFTTRQAETTVQMASGSTLMIAGLIKSSDMQSLSGFPGIQDLPIIGHLFKSKSFSRNESELVFLVTPYIVRPYAEARAVDATDEVAPASFRPSVAPPPVPPSRASAPVPHARTQATPPVYRSGVESSLRKGKARAAPSVWGAALSQSFTDNLTRVYGRKVPRVAAAGSGFGYIVD